MSFNEICEFQKFSRKGGPEFSEEAVKAIAASYDVNDGPMQMVKCLPDLENYLINLSNV